MRGNNYKIIKKLLIWFFVSLAGLSSISLASQDPCGFVRRIYDATQGITASCGVPEGDTLLLFSEELRDLFKKALAANHKYSAKHPDEKPPFADFDPFHPLPNRHKSVEVLTTPAATPPFLSSVVTVFEYEDDSVMPSARYSALMIYRLVEENGALQIQDILTIDPREENGVSSLREQIILGLRTADVAD